MTSVLSLWKLSGLAENAQREAETFDLDKIGHSGRRGSAPEFRPAQRDGSKSELLRAGAGTHTCNDRWY